KALQAINIRLVDDVSSSLTYLVVAEPSSTTGKAQKARAMGIPILSEDELIQMVGGIS
ncbi:MAG: BRCT domain-containing protein, partial [Micrococcales bacterium]|nr:BRCT domain-containing protein [Micrococcales bacterium]